MFFFLAKVCVLSSFQELESSEYNKIIIHPLATVIIVGMQSETNN